MQQHIFIFIAALFITSLISAQTFSRQGDETAEVFAASLKPDSTELAYTVIEADSLDANKKIIIAFYNKVIYESHQMDTYIDHSQYNVLMGYLLIPTSDKNYEKILIDTLFPEGGDPEIFSIFFANADKDKNKELIVLCKYEQRHYDFSGSIYATFIYDYNNGKIQCLQQLSEKFSGCECTWRDGSDKKATYKTTEDVKAGLVKFGYKQ